MSLAAPAMLLALLALPVLALLYLLRPRPRQRSSATWFLWQAVLHQRRASAWWRRLREWLGLVLLALSIIAIALALAEPRTDAQAPQDLVLLIDSSASMTAPGRTYATELLAALPPGQRALVASVDARLRLHMPLSSDHGLLRGAIDRVQARPAPLRSDSLRTIAADPSRRVVLISDGCFTGELPDHVHLQSIASDEARNAGIVQADCRLLGSGELALFARIAHNHSDNSVVDMAIRHES
ncbi:MAG: BatA domain-containing protein, partial [Planctomycetota bacterium]